MPIYLQAKFSTPKRPGWQNPQNSYLLFAKFRTGADKGRRIHYDYPDQSAIILKPKSCIRKLMNA